MPAPVGIAIVSAMIVTALAAVITGEWRWLIVTGLLAVIIRKV